MDRIDWKIDLLCSFAVLGYALGGQTGVVVALFFVIGMNIFGWWNSESIMFWSNTKINSDTQPYLYDIINQLVDKASLSMPNVYISDSPIPNAFATGRGPNLAAIRVSIGLIHNFNREEVAGAIAHELAHIQNRDVLVTTTMFVSLISILISFIFFFDPGSLGLFITIFVTAKIYMLLGPAISRKQEYQADRLGGKICGTPQWIASALKKMSSYNSAKHNPKSYIDRLFSAHPNVSDRIARLKAMDKHYVSL